MAELNATWDKLTAGYITLGANGLESGQTKPTFILFDDAFGLMQHPGSGTGVNTTPGSAYVTPDTLSLHIEFTGGSYSLAQLDIANFNPFLMVGLNRGHEVHLPDNPPTSLVNPGLFGQGQDNSTPSSGRYYKTANNLPWAINIYERFDYPQEKVDVINAYNHFVEWAKEKLAALKEAVNWLANDGVWFQAVEFSRGMFDAKRCNDSSWVQFSPFEARSIRQLLKLTDQPGLEGLKKSAGIQVICNNQQASNQSSTKQNTVFFFG